MEQNLIKGVNIMEEKTIAEMHKEISTNLLEVNRLIDILLEIEQENGRICTILEIIEKNIKYAFKNTEDCRRIIGTVYD